MKDVSTDDLNDVRRIASIFMDNVINTGDGNAARMLGKSATLPEILGLRARRIWAELSGVGQPNSAVKTYLNYCMAALPVMQRTFGEDHLLKALPPEAHDLRIIFACRSIGADPFADLCEKARMQANMPDTPATFSP
jgi:hypothetical protein